MLKKLNDMVFGFGDYEKAKIEIRFHEIIDILPELEINELEDFEILENVIFKIRELLRVKSSNLNSIIRDPKKNLTKKHVMFIIEKLDELKYAFLREAFTLIKIEKAKTIPQEINVNSDKISKLNNDLNNIISKANNEIINANNLNNATNNNSNLDLKSNPTIIFENYEVKISIENGKVPYIFIRFNDEINYPLIKKIQNIFFDLYQPHGTNILIQKNNALIIPRFNGDDLFNLPKANNLDLEQLQTQILNSIKNSKTPQNIIINSNKEKSDTITLNENDIKINPKSNSNINDKYLEEDFKLKKTNNNEETQEKEERINQNKTVYEEKNKNNDFIEFKEEDLKKTEHTKRKSDESLDELLNSSNYKTDLKPSPRPNEDKSGLTFLKDDSIEIKIDKQKTAEIEIEKKKPFEIDESKHKHLIYKDNQIIVYLRNDSKVLGEVIIDNLLKKKISQLDDSTFAYMIIFSKVFGSVLFESKGAQGTNILYNLSDTFISIVPRFENDNLGINWDPTQVTEEELEDVKKKLLSKLSEALGNNSKPEPTKSEPKKEEPKFEDKSKEDIKKKAEHILKSIRRIP